MNNQKPPKKTDDRANIQGEPLPLDELLSMAEIDADDIESAAQWWDDNASEGWEGALDAQPDDG